MATRKTSTGKTPRPPRALCALARELAGEYYSDYGVEFDADAMVVMAPNTRGAFVLGWVWVDLPPGGCIERRSA